MRLIDADEVVKFYKNMGKEFPELSVGVHFSINDIINRFVYLGLDLSETNDNTSVSMVSVDEDNNILADSWAFIPEGRINLNNIDTVKKCSFGRENSND